jgi:hypothetical protein
VVSPRAEDQLKQQARQVLRVRKLYGYSMHVRTHEMIALASSSKGRPCWSRYRASMLVGSVIGRLSLSSSVRSVKRRD